MEASTTENPIHISCFPYRVEISNRSVTSSPADAVNMLSQPIVTKITYMVTVSQSMFPDIFSPLRNVKFDLF